MFQAQTCKLRLDQHQLIIGSLPYSCGPHAVMLPLCNSQSSHWAMRAHYHFSFLFLQHGCTAPFLEA